MNPAPTTPETPMEAVRRNVSAIAQLEQSFNQKRTIADRLADTISAFTGSVFFSLAHAIMLVAWLLINTGTIPGIKPFDPFPFLLLAMSVSTEAIFLSSFVLMKQNRMARREELRAHLDLQINLLAEREMTLVIQMLEKIGARFGIELTHEEKELGAETSLDALASEVQEKLAQE